MVPYVISSHLAVRKNGKKDVDGVVRKRPAVYWIRHGLAGVKRQDVGKQSLGRSPCRLRRVAARVLQRVREDSDEARIV